MSSPKSRENTFRVDFSNLPKRMSYEETHNFVHNTLGLSLDAVVRLQVNHALNCAQVKCRDLKTAQETVIKHNAKHDVEINSTKYKVKLIMDDGGIEVKIHDLSENVTSEQICEFLKHYGDVIAVKELMWGDNFIYKGVSTGVRVAKMVLRKHIKSYVVVQGEQTLISYSGQPATCKHCANLVHPGMTCVQNKKLITQKTDLTARLTRAREERSSYADIAGSSPILMPAQNNTGFRSAEALMPEFVKLGGMRKDQEATNTAKENSKLSVHSNIEGEVAGASTSFSTAAAAGVEAAADAAEGDADVEEAVGGQLFSQSEELRTEIIIPMNVDLVEADHDTEVDSSTVSGNTENAETLSQPQILNVYSQKRVPILATDTTKVSKTSVHQSSEKHFKVPAGICDGAMEVSESELEMRAHKEFEFSSDASCHDDGFVVKRSRHRSKKARTTH